MLRLRPSRHDLHGAEAPQNGVQLGQRNGQEARHSSTSWVGERIGRRHEPKGDRAPSHNGNADITERQMMAEMETFPRWERASGCRRPYPGRRDVRDQPSGYRTGRHSATEALAYYGGLAALAAFELIDWPVAVVIAAGHLLASNHHNKLLEELGEAIEEAE